MSFTRGIKGFTRVRYRPNQMQIKMIMLVICDLLIHKHLLDLVTSYSTIQCPTPIHHQAL